MEAKSACARVDSVIPYLAQDVLFTLAQLATLNQADPHGILTGRLNLQRAGMFGVSLGAVTTAEACHMEPRLRAGLMMDAWVPDDVVRAGLRQPAMWIGRDVATMQREGWTQADIDRTQSTMRAAFAGLPGDGYLVLVPGMYHPDFSDARLFTPLMSWLHLTGPIDMHRAHAIMNAYSLAFFDKHLKDLPEPLLNGPAEEYPEVIYEAKRQFTAEAQRAQRKSD